MHFPYVYRSLIVIFLVQNPIKHQNPSFFQMFKQQRGNQVQEFDRSEPKKQRKSHENSVKTLPQMGFYLPNHGIFARKLPHLELACRQRDLHGTFLDFHERQQSREKIEIRQANPLNREKHRDIFIELHQFPAIFDESRAPNLYFPQKNIRTRNNFKIFHRKMLNR